MRDSHRVIAVVLGISLPAWVRAQTWSTYAGNPQHTADSTVASQPLLSVRWSTPVDLNPQLVDDELLIHYGSPVFTTDDTVLVPVKTGATDGFEVQALDTTNGSVKYTLNTDYSLPPHNWTPTYQPTLTPSQRLYYAGAGGTVYFRDTPDLASGASGQVAFFGNSTYLSDRTDFNTNIHINTGIVSDALGNIYFGYYNNGGANLPGGVGTVGGIARVAPNGQTTFIPVTTAAGDSSITQVALNCTPAISNDGSTLYIATTGTTKSALLALNTTTLARVGKQVLTDPFSGINTSQPSDGSATPMVGPDGDVYYGVFESSFGANHARGYMLHFSGNLSSEKTPVGDFGWDDTASVVPASLIPSYHGTSTYLIMTKYNNYAGIGGDGINKVAVLDPNDSQTDPQTGRTVMKEVLTIAGPTPDPDNITASTPNAVREWCINTAAVDPLTDSILVNNEDGVLYRWDLATNIFTQQFRLTSGLGEAYTPTLIGPDGTVYAINDARLFAVGVPEPVGIAAMTGMILLLRRRGRRATKTEFDGRPR